uniref:K Homology domain-containing protein n=1 Tax=Pectinophora gossypiella TaxID=13191 RepID=A0A1E1WFA4_PECGO
MFAVSPGAKERLVQITGPNEENVNHAKHLIGDTIRRNASPVRLEGSLDAQLCDSRASLDSAGSDEAPRPREKSPHNNSRALLHSFSTNDAALGEYKYTVTFGQHSIKITGNNLDLVKTAKLVLDEYFESAGALEAMGAGSGDFFTLSQRPGAALLLRDDAALNGADDDVFAPPNEHNDQQVGGGGGGSRQTYTYETLVQYADSPLSKVPPGGLASFPPELARKSCLEFDSASYLKKVRAAAGTTVAAVDAPDSPEPE